MIKNLFTRIAAAAAGPVLALACAGCSLIISCGTEAPPSPATTWRLTVIAGTGGTITVPSSSTVTLDSSEPIAIKAFASAGYMFLKWTTATECAKITYKNAATTNVRLMFGNDTVQAVFVPAALGLTPVNLIAAGRLEPGITYHYFTGAWTSLPDFSALDPERSDSCSSIDITGVPHRPTSFGIVFSGYVDIPFNGDYTFYAKSSDGSALLLNDSELINNDGIHAYPVEDSASVGLSVGKYLITVRYFDASSAPACTIRYACPSIGIEKQTLGTGILSRPYTGPVSKIIITAPAGGETYYLGDSLHVRWIYRHFDHMVYCEISTDNGKSYSMLSVKAFAHTDTNGYMAWKIPMDSSMITNQARIRVRDYPPGVNACVSNMFSIDGQGLAKRNFEH
jgi:hypothetical protein